MILFRDTRFSWKAHSSALLIATSITIASEPLQATEDCPGVPAPDYTLIRTGEEFASLSSDVMPSGRRAVRAQNGLPSRRLFICNDITLNRIPDWDDFEGVLLYSNGSQVRIGLDLQRPLFGRYTSGNSIEAGINNVSFDFTVPSNMTCTKLAPCNAGINYISTNVHGLLIGIFAARKIENVKVRGTLNMTIFNEDPYTGSLRNFIGGVIGESGGKLFAIESLVDVNIHHRRQSLLETDQALPRIADIHLLAPREENDLLWAGGVVGLYHGNMNGSTPNNDTPSAYTLYKIAAKGNVFVELEHLPRVILPPFREAPGIVAAVGGITGGMQSTITDSYASGELTLLRNFDDSPSIPRSRSVIAGLAGRTEHGFADWYHNGFRIRRSYSKATLAHVIEPPNGSMSFGDAWGLIGNRAIYPVTDYESRLINSYSAMDTHESDVEEYTSAARFMSDLINPGQDEFVGWDFENTWTQQTGETPRLQFESTDELTVCVPDFDNNRIVNTADLFAFLSAYFARDLRADMNDSGDISADDIFAFLSVLFPMMNQACPE